MSIALQGSFDGFLLLRQEASVTVVYFYNFLTLTPSGNPSEEGHTCVAPSSHAMSLGYIVRPFHTHKKESVRGLSGPKELDIKCQAAVLGLRSSAL